MRDFETIGRMVHDMMTARSPVLERMRAVNLRYDGDYVIPFPDLDNEPSLPPLTPMLVGEAVDAIGQRAASVQPQLTCPALNNAKDQGVRSHEYATIRRKIIHGTYHRSKWELSRRRVFRQLAAYSTASIVVLPDHKTKTPRIEARDPLGTFAEPVDASTPRPPSYVGFMTRHSSENLCYRFPWLSSNNGGPIVKGHGNTEWEIVEWIDEDQIRFVLLGPVQWHQGGHIAESYYHQGHAYMPITEPATNRLGYVPAVVPDAVSLSRMGSRLANLIGNVDLQAKLVALDILAQEKAIWPDMYAIGRQNGNPTIVGGRWKDGREGDINILQDIENVGLLRSEPSQGTQRLVDRLERNFRTSTSLVPQFGGETYGALRTGAGMNALAGMAVDPTIQELHVIMETWLPHMNAAILDTYATAWPNHRYEFFSGWPTDQGLVDFTPAKHIETTENVVKYPIPGADVVQQTQILGSLLGTKTISRRTFRKMHPWVDDDEAESTLVNEEDLEDALMQSIQMQLSQGAIPLPVVALIKKYMREKGKDIFEAIEMAEQEIQRRQATAAPPPEDPAMMAPPEAMPGLAGGPEMLMQQESPIDTQDDVARMRQLMQTMGA